MRKRSESMRDLVGQPTIDGENRFISTARYRLASRVPRRAMSEVPTEIRPFREDREGLSYLYEILSLGSAIL
jgi:hypothetical protein